MKTIGGQWIGIAPQSSVSSKPHTTSASDTLGCPDGFAERHLQPIEDETHWARTAAPPIGFGKASPNER